MLKATVRTLFRFPRFVRFRVYLHFAMHFEVDLREFQKWNLPRPQISIKATTFVGPTHQQFFPLLYLGVPNFQSRPLQVIACTRTSFAAPTIFIEVPNIAPLDYSFDSDFTTLISSKPHLLLNGINTVYSYFRV